ncbi:hypothetical protein DFH09DRAFT_1318269 [Mycena vulgaris]|nr:hypothetical protein DFH09DRAFT_1318269 [Mycena vulgaris]
MSQNIHFVPFDTWLKQVVESRTAEDDEDVTNFTSINEMRNGMLVANNLHPMIGQKNLVVLKTPNRVLDVTDIPPRSNNHPHLFGNVKYSTNPRYTLQWLQSGQQERQNVPNNMDAAFKRYSKKLKPSPLLLNYNYGVGALKWWLRKGAPTHGSEPPDCCPAGTVEEQARPLRNDRQTRGCILAALEGGSGGNTETVDIDALRQSQAEELVLILWVNTPAAQTRRAKQRAERQERMSERQNGFRMALETNSLVFYRVRRITNVYQNLNGSYSALCAAMQVTWDHSSRRPESNRGLPSNAARLF